MTDDPNTTGLHTNMTIRDNLPQNPAGSSASLSKGARRGGESPPAKSSTTTVPVRRIETISYANIPEGEPGEPLWRIVLNGYCADFPSETAARNFADQILAMKEQP